MSPEIVNLSPLKDKKESEVANRSITPLFPTLLFTSVVKDDNLLKTLQKEVMKMTKDPDAGTRAGDVGWFSHHNMHEMDEFQDLHDLLLKEMVAIFNYYGVICDSVYLTSMWANVGYRPEYMHQNHIHPNSLFSGVLHVNVPTGASGTSFGDPRPGARMIEPNYKEMSAINAGATTPQVENGTLFVFPSYLPHGVHSSYKSYGKGNQRITISFNAMMTGEITTQTAPLTLR